MVSSSRRAAVIGGLRIPFVKSQTTYDGISNQELMTFTLSKLVERYHLESKILGEVALGALIKHPSDRALARECVLGTRLDPHTPGVDLQRACGTSLEATALIANKITLGQIDCGIAAGTDTNSDLPLTLKKPLARAFIRSFQDKSILGKARAWTGLGPRDFLPEVPEAREARTGLLMGDHCELMAKEWKISRQSQDELALLSHQRAGAAYRRGFFDDLVVEYKGLKRDGFLREDTSLEKLAKLKPAFDKGPSGTLTAGNSTPLSDGAAAVLLSTEEWAREHDVPVLAYFRDAQVAGVDFAGGEGLLMAPTYAVPRMLERNGLKLQDFDFYEIHEAFAAQVLCTLAAWESADYCRSKLGLPTPLGSIDRAKLNVCGSSLAVGHPFSATGARIVATTAKLLAERGSGRALISICTAGGMGVTAIMER